jgi:hypothetical protein
MAGTKGSGRPGGNPDLAAHRFKTDRSEPLDAHLQLRIPASMKVALDGLGDRRNEFIRQAIADALASDVSEE